MSGLAPLLVAGSATAAELVEPIRITYSAPASCPDVLALVAHVQARTAQARVALPKETALEFAVRVDRTKGLFRGRLVVAASSEGPRQERELTDASCDELIEALGFFIALAVDVHAKAKAPPPLTPVAKPEPAPAPASAPTEPKPEAPPPPPSGSRPPTSGSPGKRHPEPTRGRSWHFGGGAGAALVSGVAPPVLFGARFFVDVSRERGGDSLVAPFLSVGAVSTATGTDHTPLGGTALRWQALVGALGPLAIPLFTRAVFRPCAVFEAGRVRGEGIDVANARRTDAAWIGLGVAGHLEVVIVPNLLIELEVGASAPIVRPRFDYSSGATAYRPAELGGRGSLGFAFRL